MIVMQTSGIASPIEFGTGEWLLVANALWASLVPVALRYVNKKDPAFGLVAKTAADHITELLAASAKATVKSESKPAAKKPAVKKAAPKK